MAHAAGTAREFAPVGHCGGKVTVTVVTDPDGGRKYQLGYRHSSNTPAALSSLFVSFDGRAMGFVPFGGLSDQAEAVSPPNPGIFVFIGSDVEGMYGHECPRCNGYWRSSGFPATWRMVCPYCGLRTASHNFLSAGQRKYVGEFCALVAQAMEAPDGEHEIDMDTVADAAGKDIEKPKFFYAEEAQQNQYHCESCGARQDILGRYGFCSMCGTRNELREVRAALKRIRAKLEVDGDLVGGLKGGVTEFDSAARSLARSLAQMVPMKPGRKTQLTNALFHNIKRRAEELEHWFDIRLFKGMTPEASAHAIKMFERRHVHEHNGGEVDARYLQATGDSTVRLRQALRETRGDVVGALAAIETMTANFHGQFHEIFPPDEMPISYHRPKGP